MNSRIVIPLGIVILVAFASAYILLDDDDGSSDTYRISFNANGGSGGYHIDVLPEATYYMPTANIANAAKSGCCLVGWSSGGQFYEIGAEVKGTEVSRSYDAVWVEGTATQMNLGTWSASVTKNVFGDYQDAKVKNLSISIHNYPNTVKSTGSVNGNTSYSNKVTVNASFTPSAVGTYFIDVHYTVRYSWGTDSEEGIYGEFNFGSQEEKSYTDSYIVTFVDPVKNSLRTVTWNVEGNKVESSEVLGNTITVPSAGDLDGTDNLAWWTVNYYGTGDIYILPGTKIPVEEGKCLDFVARMHGAGQGAIGYDFRGGQSSSVQIANIYDVGSEIVLPSEVTLYGYHLAGWSASFDPSIIYLPGTVIGPAIEGVNAANTDVNYIEMRAVWVRESDAHHSVTFQNSDSTCVSSAYVPHGAKVFLPVYGFDSLAGQLQKWVVDGEELDPGKTIAVDSDLIINAKYPEATSPFDTCTVVFLVGDAQTNMASAILDKGAPLYLPKVDKAYHVFCYWYEANGTVWQSGDIVNTNILLYAKWEKIFDLSAEGNTVTLDIKAGHDYEVDWGDGTKNHSDTHTYADNSRGKLTVKMLDGDYAGQSAWAIYQIGASVPSGPSEPIITPTPGPQPMPEPEPEDPKGDEDSSIYYLAGIAVATIFGLFIARRYL